MVDEISKIRNHVTWDLGNAAWLKATNHAPLDAEHCGKELWSLWYNPNELSLHSISETASLDEWKLLASRLEEAFSRSVEANR